MVRCQECHLEFLDEEKVVLDIAHGLSHKICFNGEESQIKEVNAYINLVYSYSFLRCK